MNVANAGARPCLACLFRWRLINFRRSRGLWTSTYFGVCPVAAIRRVRMHNFSASEGCLWYTNELQEVRYPPTEVWVAAEVA